MYPGRQVELSSDCKSIATKSSPGRTFARALTAGALLWGSLLEMPLRASAVIPAVDSSPAYRITNALRHRPIACILSNSTPSSARAEAPPVRRECPPKSGPPLVGHVVLSPIAWAIAVMVRTAASLLMCSPALVGKRGSVSTCFSRDSANSLHL